MKARAFKVNLERGEKAPVPSCPSKKKFDIFLTLFREENFRETPGTAFLDPSGLTFLFHKGLKPFLGAVFKSSVKRALKKPGSHQIGRPRPS